MTIESKPIKSIAIIGGGASGAIALDTFIKQKTFDQITVFERRDVLGGVWVFDPQPPELDIAPGSSFTELDPPISSPNFTSDTVLKESPTQQRYHETPSYGWMRTNVIEQFMTYSDLKKWPQLDREGEDTFTSGKFIAQYINEYFNRHDPKHVVLNTTVEDVSKDYSNPDAKFLLTLRTNTGITNSEGKKLDIWYKEEYDAVVVTVGHYHVPYIPPVEGLSEIYHHFPNKLEHSKTFRSIDKYKDKVVIVIGSRSSGADIAKFISQVTEITYNSTRSIYAFSKTIESVISKPTISKYQLTDSGFDVIFSDGSIVSNPDYIVYGTGYQFSYPFLQKIWPNLTTGKIVPDLYQHTFLIQDPLITFIGIPTDAISFRAFEYQAVLISRFYAGLVNLPSIEQQKDWAKQRFETKGDTRAYHTIGIEDALGYMDTLTELGGGVTVKSGVGRDFPVFNKDDVETYKKVKETLAKFWDEK